MNKEITSIHRMTEQWNDDYVPGTAEYRIGLVWPLTYEIASLSVKHDVERRLQRHITCLSDEKVRFILVGAYALVRPWLSHEPLWILIFGSCHLLRMLMPS